MALTEVTFRFTKGGKLTQKMDISPLRMKQFNYDVLEWDYLDALQVRAA